MNSKVSHTEDERLLYFNDNIFQKEFQPKYSTEKSYELFEKIIYDFNKDKNLTKKVTVKGYNLLSTVFEDIFWQYCFNYIKYKEFIEEYGLNHEIQDPKDKWVFSGISRVKNFLHGPPKVDEKNLFIYKCQFIKDTLRALLSGLIRGQKTIWVQDFLFDNFRFSNLSNLINKRNIRQISPMPSSNRKSTSEINIAIVEEVNRKTSNYKWWIFAIRLLKPKRIIVNDNLHSDFSILLAAKITGVEIVGVSHGMVSKFHRGQFGSKHIEKDILLKFDKFYVWDRQFKDLLIKRGHIYEPERIRVCGFLNMKKYPKISNKKKKFVLYPFEHLANYESVSEILEFFESKNYKIIIKSRPDMKNYGHFPNIDFELVDDFTREHLDKALCFVGSTTTLLFNLSTIGLPIVLPKESGLNILSEISLPNWIFFDENFSISVLSKSFSQVHLSPPQTSFLREFLA